MLMATSGCLGQSLSLSNWPNGHKSAVVLSFDLEQAQAEDIKKVIDLLERYNADATFFVVAGYYEDSPALLNPLKSYEVASKGWDQGKWSEKLDSQRESIRRAHEFFTSHGFNPVGFRAPFLRNSEETFEVLSDMGYRYDSSEVGLTPNLRNGIIELPLSVAYDPFWNNDVEDYLPLLYLTFDATYDRQGLFLFYTLPEHVNDRLRVFMEHVVSKDVWLASGRDIAEWWSARDLISLEVKGKTAIVTNNGASPISGVTLLTGNEDIILPEIKPGETVKIMI
jgi:peptidoglycan/xylan/chitin deacetylase (PgdA/CDA1 family)